MIQLPLFGTFDVPNIGTITLMGGPDVLTRFAGRFQIENDAPQPHDEAAFGFLTWNEAPTSSST